MPCFTAIVCCQANDHMAMAGRRRGPSATDGGPPHIVLFLIDDLGWRDLGWRDLGWRDLGWRDLGCQDFGCRDFGCQGRSFYRTPHIDRLTRDGVR
jgi:arylsulfatase A-like enzyme